VKEIPQARGGAARPHGAGMMDCKKALEETGGDLEKAVDVLRTKGAAKADNGRSRASQGLTATTLDTTEIEPASDVLVELNCETDFVARTEDFKTLARELGPSTSPPKNPLAVRIEEPAGRDRRAGSRQVYELRWPSRKSPRTRAKIVEGMIKRSTKKTSYSSKRS